MGEVGVTFFAPFVFRMVQGLKLTTRVLKCLDCSADIDFTAGEQQFYYEKHFGNEPKRCKARKSQRASQPDSRPSRNACPPIESKQSLFAVNAE